MRLEHSMVTDDGKRADFQAETFLRMHGETKHRRRFPTNQANEFTLGEVLTWAEMDLDATVDRQAHPRWLPRSSRTIEAAIQGPSGAANNQFPTPRLTGSPQWGPLVDSSACNGARS